MTQVFISYARSDQSIARRVAKTLQAAGFEVWWDDQLPAHRSYSDVIEGHLHAARAVVVLWSGEAAKSQWVRAEADFGRSAGTLVQARLDGTLPPMPFNQIQCADLKGWRGSGKHPGWAKLKASVAVLVSGEEPAAMPATAPAKWWTLPKARWLAAAALALLVAAAFLVPLLIGERNTERPVVAVLPFESLNARDESLVAGIWEDTRQAIGRNPQLLVLGPNTAEEIAAKGSGAARKLADYLVEANVRSVGDRIRVSANLVRTKDGSEMWSKNFDRRLDDVFALQSEIAGEIEGHIRGRLAERGGMQPENIATTGEVYAEYSNARTTIRKRNVDSYAKAYEKLVGVVHTDPNFAPGWATLAVAKVLGAADLRGSAPATNAEADARRAVALAPNLAAAHAALGLVLGTGPAAQAELQKAIRLDPNDVEALNWLASSLDEGTAAQEKLRIYDRIIEIEPLWWPAVLNKLDLLLETGDMAGAEQELARLNRLGASRLTTATRMKILSKKGDLSAAIDLGLGFYRKASPADREFIEGYLLEPLFQLGYYELADKISPPRNHFIPYIRANDPRALDIFETEMPPKAFWTYGLLGMVGPRVYLLNKQGARLARLYRAVASTPEQFEQVVGKDRLPEIAPNAALALRAAGDETQAQALLKLAEADAQSSGRASPEDDIRLARIYAVQGRADEALGLLSSAVRSGWLPPYLPLHTDLALDPPLNELRQDPRFERMRQQILGHLAKERAELGPRFAQLTSEQLGV